MALKQTVWLWGLGILLGVGAILPAAQADQIIDIQGGTASLRRGGSRHPAPVGTTLQGGDLVSPTRGATVAVRCRNGHIARRSYLFGRADVCPDSGTRRYRLGGRGEDDFLLFLEHRFVYASQVLTADPVLRWDGAAGASRYSLQLWDAGQAVFNPTTRLWTETVQGATAYHRENALPEPGRYYQLEVTAAIAPPTTTTLQLRRLPNPEAIAIQEQVTAIATLDPPLSPEAQAVAIARLYLEVAQPNTDPPEGTGLVLDAIPVLEAVAPASSTPYVHRLLGDCYLQVGALAAAHAAYDWTLQLTQTTPDLASRAAAEVGLANLAAARGDRPAAYRWLQQAQVSYSWLGEGDRVAQVQRWLDSLDTPLAEAPSR